MGFFYSKIVLLQNENELMSEAEYRHVRSPITFARFGLWEDNGNVNDKKWLGKLLYIFFL